VHIAIFGAHIFLTHMAIFAHSYFCILTYLGFMVFKYFWPETALIRLF